MRNLNIFFPLIIAITFFSRCLNKPEDDIRTVGEEGLNYTIARTYDNNQALVNLNLREFDDRQNTVKHFYVFKSYTLSGEERKYISLRENYFDQSHELLKSYVWYKFESNFQFSIETWNYKRRGREILRVDSVINTKGDTVWQNFVFIRRDNKNRFLSFEGYHDADTSNAKKWLSSRFVYDKYLPYRDYEEYHEAYRNWTYDSLTQKYIALENEKDYSLYKYDSTGKCIYKIFVNQINDDRDSISYVYGEDGRLDTTKHYDKYRQLVKTTVYEYDKILIEDYLLQTGFETPIKPKSHPAYWLKENFLRNLNWP